MLNFIGSITRETVAVHLTNGASLRGVLLATHRDCIVLAHAVLLQEDGSTLPLDGEQVVPRQQLLWLQLLTEVAS